MRWLIVDPAEAHQEEKGGQLGVAPHLGTPEDGVSSIWHNLPSQAIVGQLPSIRKEKTWFTGVWRARDKSADDDVQTCE